MVDGLQPWVMEEAVREVVIQSEKDQTLEGLRKKVAKQKKSWLGYYSMKNNDTFNAEQETQIESFFQTQQAEHQVEKDKGVRDWLDLHL